MSSTQNLFLIAPVLLFSMVAHEYAHGYVALRNGDMTAYQLGRLTWNPLKHIDPFMTILLPLMLILGSQAVGGRPVILGGAKPVPVNPRNYKNFKRGDIMVSLAGVTTNLVIALLCVPLIILTNFFGSAVNGLSEAASIFQMMLWFGILINVQLATFNLLPIPPLDGSHVMKYLLPPAWSLSYQRMARYGILIVLGLLWFGGPLLDFWFKPAFALIRGLYSLASPFLIPSRWTSQLN